MNPRELVVAATALIFLTGSAIAITPEEQERVVAFLETQSGTEAAITKLIQNGGETLVEAAPFR